MMVAVVVVVEKWSEVKTCGGSSQDFSVRVELVGFEMKAAMEE